MTSQKSPALITEWIELQPSCARGKTVGLFSTGKIEAISSMRSLGAFNKIYFDFLARYTALMRNRILLIHSNCSSVTLGP